MQQQSPTQGLELLNELSEATGLPDMLIGEELSRLISSAGKSVENVTLDELREMLGAYLQEVLLEAKTSLRTDALPEVHAVAEAILEQPEPATAIIIDLKPALKLAVEPTFQMFSHLGSTAPDFIAES